MFIKTLLLYQGSQWSAVYGRVVRSVLRQILDRACCCHQVGLTPSDKNASSGSELVEACFIVSSTVQGNDIQRGAAVCELTRRGGLGDRNADRWTSRLSLTDPRFICIC